jgi:hypothetical protein
MIWNVRLGVDIAGQGSRLPLNVTVQASDVVHVGHESSPDTIRELPLLDMKHVTSPRFSTSSQPDRPPDRPSGAVISVGVSPSGQYVFGSLIQPHLPQVAHSGRRIHTHTRPSDFEDIHIARLSTLSDHTDSFTRHTAPTMSTYAHQRNASAVCWVCTEILDGAKGPDGRPIQIVVARCGESWLSAPRLDSTSRLG